MSDSLIARTRRRIAGFVPRLDMSLVYYCLLQFVGMGVQLLATVFISRNWGAAGQGQFALVKSWNDLVSGSLQLGLPQGYVYAINKGGWSRGYVHKWSIIQSALAMLVYMSLIPAAISFGYLPKQLASIAGYVSLAIAGFGYVYLSLARAIYLTIDDGVRFGILSVMPSVALFLAAIGLSSWSDINFAVVFAVSGGTAAIVSFFMLRRRLPKASGQNADAIGWRVTMSQSSHAFVQNILIGLLQPGAIAIILYYGASLEDIGNLSVSLVAIAAMSSLVSMISPILYNRWSKDGDAGSLVGRYWTIILWSQMIGFATLFVVLAFAPVIISIFGDGFGQSVGLIRIIALSIPSLILVRLLTPLALAMGKPAVGTHAYLLRLILLCLSTVFLIRADVDPLYAVAISWALSEWAGGLHIAWSIGWNRDYGIRA